MQTNIVCGVIYKQHYYPEQLLQYLDTMSKKKKNAASIYDYSNISEENLHDNVSETVWDKFMTNAFLPFVKKLNKLIN